MAQPIYTPLDNDETTRVVFFGKNYRVGPKTKRHEIDLRSDICVCVTHFFDILATTPLGLRVGLALEVGNTSPVVEKHSTCANRR